MIHKTGPEDYLLKAASAEAIADRLSGSQRESWLDIAEGYRALASSLRQAAAENPSKDSPPASPGG